MIAERGGEDMRKSRLELRFEPEEIKAAYLRQNLTLKEVAKKIGITINTLRHAMEGGFLRTPSYRKIQKALEVGEELDETNHLPKKKFDAVKLWEALERMGLDVDEDAVADKIGVQPVRLDNALLGRKISARNYEKIAKFFGIEEED